jgi:hypothetical protein
MANMNIKNQLLLLVMVFVLSSKGYSQTCTDLFKDKDEAIYFGILKKSFETEFSIVMNSAFEMALKSFVFSEGEFAKNPQHKQVLINYISLNHIINFSQKSLAENALKRKLTNTEATALRVAKVLDRDFDFYDGTKDEFTANESFDLKQRFLKLFGFKEEEIRLLYELDIVNDNFLAESRYELSSLYAKEDVPTELIYKKNEMVFAAAKKFKNSVSKKIELMKTEKPELYNRLKKEGRIPRAALNYKQAEKLLDVVTFNSHTRLMALKKYDPKGIFGFCFGRAHIMEDVLDHHGVHQDSIKRVFVAGPMKGFSSRVTWGYHVATMVSRTGGGFWVLDPVIGKPMILEEWFDHYNKTSKDGRLRLFITNGSRFGQVGFNDVTKAELYKDGSYNDYFNNSKKSLQKNNYGEEKDISPLIQGFNKVLDFLNLSF